MSQSYVKECIFCKKEIQMSDKGGKWLPYNPDGSLHECKKQDNGNGKEKTKQEFTLEQVKKKLASIGIILDLDKLMNSK